MYKKYRLNLDKWIDRKESMEDRIIKFKEVIEGKEIEIEELKESFASDFVNGNKTNDKKLNQLKIDIVDSKEQLVLIEKTLENDKELHELGNLIYKEHRELLDQDSKDTNKESQEIEKLEKSLEIARKKILDKRSNRKDLIKSQLKERLEALDYMENVPVGERKHLEASAKY